MSLLLLGLPLGVSAAPQASDTVVVVPGAHYDAGAVHRWVLGAHYRDLWTTPIRVPVLDLGGFARGLEPLRRGGGMQTRSLRFRGGDGREYSFRSVDKDPSPVLDSILHDTFIDDLVQDGISAAHPLGALVAPRLLEAAGVLHADPRLYVLPDDPTLGEFRDDFAGMLGLLEEVPDENEGQETSFQGALRVVGSDRLMERVEESPQDLVDTEAFLVARMMDVFLGDWDRHRLQWRWATYDQGPIRRWLPVPEDRDQAFAKLDGFVPRIVGLYLLPFVRFEGTYPSIDRLHWQGRELDRRFLSGLDRRAWDSIGAVVQSRLTDDVIRHAVQALPPEHRAIGGDELTGALMSRRDRLPEAWSAFYDLLAENVDIYGTDADEYVVVERVDDRWLDVALASPEDWPAIRLRRRFDALETEEVRLYLKGGEDIVQVRGSGTVPITVRVVGGGGDDVFQIEGSGGDLRIYDSRGDNTVSGSTLVRVDERNFAEWVWTEADRSQPRDWGSRRTPMFWSSFSSDLGLFLGGGVHVEGYGFRARPYRSAISLRGGYSVNAHKGRVEGDYRIYRENSPLFASAGLRYSGLDVVNFFGFGNESEGGPEDRYAVDLHMAAAAAGVGASLGSGLTLRGEAVISASSTSEEESRYFTSLRDSLYGAAGFVQAGVVMGAEYDPYGGDDVRAIRFRVRTEAELFPAMFDVEETFGAVDGEVSILIRPAPPLSLALRGGGRKVWGRFPWAESAFLGSATTLRGWHEQRFAGDASGYGSAEARLRLFRAPIVVPVSVGVFGFFDVGRVWVDGASPGGWHAGAGGGVWFEPFGQPNILRLGVGAGDESTKLYASLGIPY